VKRLGGVLYGLPPREVRILQLRYGLLTGQAYTLEEVSRKMGVTRERVRQIEAQALSRLRHPTLRRKLRDYLGE
jgi:RNA polymerase primary sigma factor